MRILVLGGTNFIGPAAVRILAVSGHEVAVFHRGKSNAPLPENVRHIHGDRAQIADFRDTFKQFSPEVVLDMVPSTEKAGNMLIEQFSGLARRLVAISSVDVYRAYDRFRKADPGPPDPAPLTEDSPLRDKLFPYRSTAKSPDEFMYHYDKILMERAVMSVPETLPGTILRLPMVYGPGDYQHRVFSYLKRMDDGRPAILVSSEMAAWRAERGYVEDMGHAIALCVTCEQAAGRTYHVAEQRDLSEREWLQRIAAAAGWKGSFVFLPEESMPQHLREDYDTTQDLALDSTRIRHELGYGEQKSPEEAMRRTVEWERANPQAKFDPAEYDYAAEDAALAVA
jgi:nucleoside-diphosphate-sugar epimerase